MLWHHLPTRCEERKGGGLGLEHGSTERGKGIMRRMQFCTTCCDVVLSYSSVIPLSTYVYVSLAQTTTKGVTIIDISQKMVLAIVLTSADNRTMGKMGKMGAGGREGSEAIWFQQLQTPPDLQHLLVPEDAGPSGDSVMVVAKVVGAVAGGL